MVPANRLVSTMATSPSTKKSVVAAGLGVLLLTGVGGSFAMWSESQTVDAGTVTAGHLDMTVSAGTWYDTLGTTATTDDVEIDPSTFLMVPGDTLEYRATIDPDLVGDNLEASLTADLSTASGALADFVDVGATLGGAESQVLTPASTAAGETFEAVVRVAMPYGAGTVTDPDGGEDTSLDLTSLTISLVQTPNP